MTVISVGVHEWRRGLHQEWEQLLAKSSSVAAALQLVTMVPAAAATLGDMSRCHAVTRKIFVTKHSSRGSADGGQLISANGLCYS